MAYTEGTCEPLFRTISTWSAIVYTLTFTAHPHTTSSAGYLDASLIATEVLNQLHHHAENMYINEVLVTSFIRVKSDMASTLEQLHRENRSLAPADVDYIAFQANFIEVSVDNTSCRIEELSKLLPQLNSSEYQLFHRNISDSQFKKSASARYSQPTVSDVNITAYLSTMYVPDWLRDGLTYGYDSDTGHGVLPLARPYITHHSRAIFSVPADPTCPKVVLNTGDYNMTIDETSVYFNELKGNIPKSALSFSENGEYVSVCHHTYVSLVEKFKDNRSDWNALFHPLDLLTIVCTILSLLSLAFSLFTYCMFRSLRTIPGLNNMALITSLIVWMSLTLVNTCVGAVDTRVCRVIGITVHFSLLSSFGWMFICTFHMCKVFSTMQDRTIKASGHKTFTIYSIAAETTSALIVAATIISSSVTSDGESIGYTESPCYVDPDMLVYNVAIPVGLTVTLNIGMYIFVIFTISRMSDIQQSKSQERNNLIIFVKLSTITGLTWVFGFVYQFTNIEVFAYIFTVLNASQGVFIMLSFVVNKRVLAMYRRRGTLHRPATSSMTTKDTSFAHIADKTENH